MSISVDGSGADAAYLTLAGTYGVSAWPTVAYLDSVWVRLTGTSAQHFLIGTGENAASNTESNMLSITGSTNGSPYAAQARTTDSGGTSRLATINSTNVPSVTWPGTDVWYHVAAAYQAVDDRKSYSEGGDAGGGYEFRGTASGAGDYAFAYSRIGGTFASVGSTHECYEAELSRWNTTGFTEQQCDDLVLRLATTIGGEVPDPRVVNRDLGAAWEGKLLRYNQFNDITDLTDLVGGVDTWVATVPGSGALQTHAEHPDVQTYAASPTVTVIDPSPLVDGAAFTITGVALMPLDTAPTLDIGGVSQTVSTADYYEITGTAVLGALLYGREYAVLITDENNDVNIDDVTATFTTPAGEAYADITETPPADNDPPIRIAATPDITIGSQVHYRTLISAVGGDSATVSISYVTVQANGAVSFDSNNVTMPCSLQVRVNHNDGEGWSAFETLDFDTAGGDPEPELIGASESYFIAQAGVQFTATLGELVTSGDWTWAVQSGELPSGLHLENDGDITGVPTVIGPFVAVIRVTGTLTYVDLTVYFVITQEAITTPTGRRSGDDEQIRAEDAMVIGLIKEFLAMMTKGA